jgi:hypothetical protein
MEVVLQWLDELDDLVFAAFSIWSRLRRFCLAVAVIAATSIHALPLLGLPIQAALVLAQVSLASLGIWAISGTLLARADRSVKAPAVNA